MTEQPARNVCPNCFADLQPGQVTCPTCGFDLSGALPPESGRAGAA